MRTLAGTILVKVAAAASIGTFRVSLASERHQLSASLESSACTGLCSAGIPAPCYMSSVFTYRRDNFGTPFGFAGLDTT